VFYFFFIFIFGFLKKMKTLYNKYFYHVINT